MLGYWSGPLSGLQWDPLSDRSWDSEMDALSERLSVHMSDISNFIHPHIPMDLLHCLLFVWCMIDHRQTHMTLFLFFQLNLL